MFRMSRVRFGSTDDRSRSSPMLSRRLLSLPSIPCGLTAHDLRPFSFGVIQESRSPCEPQRGYTVSVLKLIAALLRGLSGNRAALMAENLALRQRLAVLQRFIKRPRLRPRSAGIARAQPGR